MIIDWIGGGLIILGILAICSIIWVATLEDRIEKLEVANLELLRRINHIKTK